MNNSHTHASNDAKIKPSQALLLELALPVPLAQTFDYLPPKDFDPKKVHDLLPGILVSVPFGPRIVIGVLLNVKTDSAIDVKKLRYARSIHHQFPLFTSESLKLCHWLSNYYHHPIGEVFATAIPPKARNEKGLSLLTEKLSTVIFEHTQEGLGLGFNALKRSPKQQILHQYLLDNTILFKTETKSLQISNATLKALIDKKLVRQRQLSAKEKEAFLSTKKKIYSNTQTGQILAESPRELNKEQLNVKQNIQFHYFKTYLLHGVTGSGKTEIYLQLAQQALQRSGQVLILIPEIGLSPQTIERFKQRFKLQIAELHSNISETQRATTWMKIKSGEVRLVVGTRLAALAPFKELGLIVVDEEHDTSYKQTDGLRYSARDISIYRAQQLGIPIILGSATPSIESLNHARMGRFKYLTIKRRASGISDPDIKIIDIRQQKLHGGLAHESIDAIELSLQRGEQVLVFVNRRGFASIVQCHNCGWTAQCKNCDHRLTLHLQHNGLLCHQCDRRYAVPKNCDNCQSSNLKTSGLGTEQSEQTLQKRFPNATILRIDRDSTRQKQAFSDSLKKINGGEPCILVGTQMLAKGHDFPKLSLAIIVDADQGLMSADFRGPERMGQLITQVAGRAGRADIRGQVLIQTHCADHPLMQSLINEGYSRFADTILNQRQQALQVPYSYLAIFRCEDIKAEQAIELLRTLKNTLENFLTSELHIIGPIPEAYERVNNRFRYQLRLNGQSRSNLHSVIKHGCDFLRTNKQLKRLRWSVDVDAYAD